MGKRARRQLVHQQCLQNVLQRALCFCDAISLARSSSVCKHWHGVADEDELWFKVFSTDYPNSCSLEREALAEIGKPGCTAKQVYALMREYDRGSQLPRFNSKELELEPIPARLAFIRTLAKQLDSNQWQLLFVHGRIAILLRRICDWAALVSLAALQILARASLRYRHILGSFATTPVLEALPTSRFKNYCVLVLMRLSYQSHRNASLLTGGLGCLMTELKSVKGSSEREEGLAGSILGTLMNMTDRAKKNKHILAKKYDLVGVLLDLDRRALFNINSEVYRWCAGCLMNVSHDDELSRIFASNHSLLSLLLKLAASQDRECSFYATATLAGLTVARAADGSGSFVEYFSEQLEQLHVREYVVTASETMAPGFAMEGSVCLNNFRQCLQQLPLDSVNIRWVLWTIDHILSCEAAATASSTGGSAATEASAGFDGDNTGVDGATANAYVVMDLAFPSEQHLQPRSHTEAGRVLDEIGLEPFERCQHATTVLTSNLAKRILAALQVASSSSSQSTADSRV